MLTVENRGKTREHASRYATKRLPYPLRPCLIAAVLAVATLCGRCRAEAEVAGGVQPAAAEVLAADGHRLLTREEVGKRLAELAGGEPPAELAMGMISIEAKAAPDNVPYVCPMCGARTVYAVGVNRKSWDVVSRVIPLCRQALKNVQGVMLRLDESQFCRQCSPNIRDPGLVLMVRYAGDVTVHAAGGITDNDARLVSEFLAGSNKHVYGNAGEAPLKKYIPRLEELLGVKLAPGAATP